MRVSDLFESNVVPGSFGSGGSDGIDIPKGYETFYTKKAGPNSSHIVGVKPDGSEHVISTAQTELAELLAKHYNSGGQAYTGIKPISMLDAFGSPFEKALNELHGISMAEKPQDFNSIPEISAWQLRKIEKAMGEKLPVMTAEEFFEESFETMADITPDAPETTLVKFPGGYYVADRGGARSYARMWLKIAG